MNRLPSAVAPISITAILFVLLGGLAPAVAQSVPDRSEPEAWDAFVRSSMHEIRADLRARLAVANPQEAPARVTGAGETATESAPVVAEYVRRGGAPLVLAAVASPAAESAPASSAETEVRSAMQGADGDPRPRVLPGFPTDEIGISQRTAWQAVDGEKITRAWPASVRNAGGNR